MTKEEDLKILENHFLRRNDVLQLFVEYCKIISDYILTINPHSPLPVIAINSIYEIHAIKGIRAAGLTFFLKEGAFEIIIEPNLDLSYKWTWERKRNNIKDLNDPELVKIIKSTERSEEDPFRGKIKL